MSSTATTHTQSLYERLGGSEGIRRIVEDIGEAHLANPDIQARYRPIASDPEKWEAIKQSLCDFIAAGTGGPEVYNGPDMLEVHRGMNVSEREFVAAIDDIMAGLEKNGVDEDSKKDMLAIAYSLKNEIIHL